MKKEIGFIGLGRMGLNMAEHLVEKGYRVVGVDPSEEMRAKATKVGVEVMELEDMVSTLSEPKCVWIMVPSKFVGFVIDELAPILNSGNTIIDGGNSFYQDSLQRHRILDEEEINFLDCGISGGMNGARNGASIMVGGKKDVFDEHEHIFKALAAPNGYALVGKEGAGHFVKMIHNGIEYGMMGAIAEGINVLHEHEENFDIDLKEVFKPYENESIITSKLITWLRVAYEEGQIEEIAGVVPKGETEEEMGHIVSIGNVKVLEAALQQRKITREEESYIGKLVSAMRNQFGGHKTVAKK